MENILSLIPENFITIYRDLINKYSPQIEKMQIHSKEYLFLRPGDISFVEYMDLRNSLDFPYWVKIWDASVILGEFLVSMKGYHTKNTKNKTLELGSGLGISGIIAADHGYDVTITDYGQDILNFPRISCAINGIKNVRCQLLDWKNPKELGEFDLIIGSELIYHKSLFDPLLNVMKKYLKSDGIIYLAQDSRRKSLREFIELCSYDFDIGVKKRTLCSGGESIEILLFRLSFKR